jgi:hypothetical protein
MKRAEFKHAFVRCEMPEGLCMERPERRVYSRDKFADGEKCGNVY